MEEARSSSSLIAGTKCLARPFPAASAGWFSARFHKDGSATVSGTLNCSNASFVEIDVQLQQTVGRLKVNGFSFSEGVCDGTTHTWSADVTGDNGLFRGGKATVNADLFICELDCIDQFVSRTVSIKK